MREILFRGKRRDNGEWVEGYLMDANYINSPFNDDEACGRFDDPIEVDPETVCQYTDWGGWGNENNRKIFEGDIIKVDDSWIGIVVWDFNDTSFNVEPVYDDMEEVERLGVVINGSYVEVIGNIFDNPELIEADKQG